MATEFERKTVKSKEFLVEKGLIDYIRDADDGRRDFSNTQIQVNLEIKTNEMRNERRDDR